MEVILQFIASALANGAIGHYVGEGLRKINGNLPDKLRNQSDLADAIRIVKDNQLEEDLMKLASDVRSKMNDQINTDNIINFSGNNNSGVVANNIENIEIKTSKKNVTINAPDGSIASSLKHKNYTKHLIDRYHEFKKAETKGNMNYAIFYGAIKKEFGAKWDMIPLSRFTDLSAFLQKRIDNTILGRNKKSKNTKRYSTFEEYVAKHGM